MSRPELDRVLRDLDADKEDAVYALRDLPMEQRAVRDGPPYVQVARMDASRPDLSLADMSGMNASVTYSRYTVELKQYGWSGAAVVSQHRRQEVPSQLRALGFDVRLPPWVEYGLKRNPSRSVLWTWWRLRYARQAPRPNPFAPEFEASERAHKPWPHRRAMRVWSWWQRKRFSRIPTKVLRRQYRAAWGIPENPWERVTIRFDVRMVLGIDTDDHLDIPVVYHHLISTRAQSMVMPVLVLHAYRETS